MFSWILVAFEDGGYLEVYPGGAGIEDRVVIRTKGPRGGNRHILWLTYPEAESLREALTQIVEGRKDEQGSLSERRINHIITEAKSHRFSGLEDLIAWLHEVERTETEEALKGYELRIE